MYHLVKRYRGGGNENPGRERLAGRGAEDQRTVEFILWDHIIIILNISI